MSQKLPVNGFKCAKKSNFNEVFIKKYDENSNTGHFLEVDVEYPKTLLDSHKDLPFLAEREKVEKVRKRVCCTEDKEKICYSHKSFKTSTKSQLKTKRGTQSNSVQSRSMVKTIN